MSDDNNRQAPPGWFADLMAATLPRPDGPRPPRWSDRTYFLPGGECYRPGGTFDDPDLPWSIHWFDASTGLRGQFLASSIDPQANCRQGAEDIARAMLKRRPQLITWVGQGAVINP